MPKQLREWFMVKRTGDTAQIELFDELGGWFGIPIQQFKDRLDSVSDAKELTLLVNSPGGSVFDGVALYHMLTPFKDKLSVEVVGLCASAATLPALAGKKLSMGKGTYFMIHNPAAGIFGEAKELRKRADLLDQIKEEVVDVYVSHSNMSREEAQNAMDTETWLTAQQAVDAGFAGEILDRGIVTNSVGDLVANAEAYGWTNAPAIYSNGTNPGAPALPDPKPRWKVPPQEPAHGDGNNGSKEDSMNLSDVLEFAKSAKPEERAQMAAVLGLDVKANETLVSENASLKSKTATLEESLTKVSERCKTLEQKEHDGAKKEAIENALTRGVILDKERSKWEERFDENPEFVAKLLKDLPKVVDYEVHGNGQGGGEQTAVSVEDKEALARLNADRSKRGEALLTMEQYLKLQG